MAGEQPWCATPTAILCCWSKEPWIDDWAATPAAVVKTPEPHFLDSAILAASQGLTLGRIRIRG
jgi:hypothetical protein